MDLRYRIVRFMRCLQSGLYKELKAESWSASAYRNKGARSILICCSVITGDLKILVRLKAAKRGVKRSHVCYA